MAEAPTHASEMHAALELERTAQRALLEGCRERAQRLFGEAAARYRASWELASPTSYGRLIGMQKAAILAGGGEEQAPYVRSALAQLQELTPAAAYALAIADLLLDDDAGALARAKAMRAGGGAFERTAEAIEALAQGQAQRYEAAVRAIVADFESRREHLTGVAIADTALMLQELAARKAIRVDLQSDLVGPGVQRAEAGGER
ncbi:MAG TPA: hypothetical protein VKU89_06675 [Solirubrobacteraceae bacterium]|nr:hypothetical protein [Solirubrobacteraceae bacterium]